MIFVQLPARSWPVCPCQCPLSGSQASPHRSLGLPVSVRSQILISAASCLFLLLPSPLQLLVEQSQSLAVSRMQVGATADSHPLWSKSPICVEETSPKMGENTESSPLCPVGTDFYATLQLTPVETLLSWLFTNLFPSPRPHHQPTFQLLRSFFLSNAPHQTFFTPIQPLRYSTCLLLVPTTASFSLLPTHPRARPDIHGLQNLSTLLVLNH